MPPLRMAVVGVGHLGQAHARILAAMPDVELVGVADVSAAQAGLVAERHACRAYTHYGPLLDQVDAATIVAPTCHHHSIASAFLDRGVPLLVEKPLAPTIEQADDLVRLARLRGATLQVGHVERFNPAFEALCGRPIRPKFVECERHGPFTGRSTDIGAVLDLMVHDLDLLRALDGSPVVNVEAMGITVFGGQEDLVNARLRFASGRGSAARTGWPRSPWRRECWRACGRTSGRAGRTGQPGRPTCRPRAAGWSTATAERPRSPFGNLRPPLRSSRSAGRLRLLQRTG